MDALDRQFMPGDWAEVRSLREILATLDADGSLEALPFMPEMTPCCGRRFRVFKRAARTCVEEGGMRRMHNTVMLENLRCQGEAHGECDRLCLFFWKDAWLRWVDPAAPPPPPKAPDGPDPALPVMKEGRYFCQLTQLMQATERIGRWDFTQFWHDWHARTFPPLTFLRFMTYAVVVRVRQRLLGVPFASVQGHLARTPVAELNLKPGEMVEVKSRQEIAATLDRKNHNRGLSFSAEMLPYCGRRLRVLRRVNCVILPDGSALAMRNTVILDGCICDGRTSRWGGCPRANLHFWREIWLRRAAPAVAEVLPERAAPAEEEPEVLTHAKHTTFDSRDLPA